MGLKIKNYRPVSRILSGAVALPGSVIYLDRTSLSGSALPTPLVATRIPGMSVCEQHTPALADTRCTWHFNPQGLSARFVTEAGCALLPHIFTLTPWLAGPTAWRLFSVTLSMFFR